ncbi:MAG: hypothetical protein NXI04_12375 [Planctomycetaceae bacterium]|nr:hypothetical protein [Planctomycetaceae bacterium]
MSDLTDTPTPAPLAILAAELQQQILESQSTYWLGIAGPPGSGKSTLADLLAEQLSGSVIIPMDGYHLYRSELDALDHPAEAHARRGAPFTFNGRRFVEDLQNAKASGQGRFPDFEHGTGDPVENAISLTVGTKMVIVEGNYLLLPEAPWSLLRHVFDETWFVDEPLDVCCQRIIARHQRVGRTAEQAQHRVATNDRLNAELVITACRHRADRRVRLADQRPLTE